MSVSLCCKETFVSWPCPFPGHLMPFSLNSRVWTCSPVFFCLFPRSVVAKTYNSDWAFLIFLKPLPRWLYKHANRFGMLYLLLLLTVAIKEIPLSPCNFVDSSICHICWQVINQNPNQFSWKKYMWVWVHIACAAHGSAANKHTKPWGKALLFWISFQVLFLFFCFVFPERLAYSVSCSCCHVRTVCWSTH